MDSRRGKSRGKSNRPLKRSLRRAVAWLLVFCMCMANMNSAAFAAEIATASNALMAATPSDAKATDSDAMEILMPEEVISGEDLATEAARAISEGNEFDFDSEIQVKKDDQGKDEGYEELFKGRRSFVLFADNGNGGRIQGDNPNAYGYILVQVDEKDYKAFEEEAGAAKATDSNATDSDAAERSWTLTGDEELVFLYINADDGSVTFTLNIENLQADDIVVPSYSELREEQKAEEEESKEESEANNPAAQPAEDGSENGGSAGGSGSGSGSGSAGSSDSAGDMEEIEDADKPDGSSDGQGSESGTDGGSEDSTDGAGQGSEDAGNSDSSDGAEDADKPDDSDDGQNGGQDAGNSAEDGNGSQSGSGSDTGSGDTDSGKAEGSGDAGSQKPDDSDDGQNSGSDHGSDTGNSGSGTEGDRNSGSGSEGNAGSGNTGSSDKGDSGKGDSNKGDSGSSSSDKGSSDTGNSGSSSDKGSSDKGGSSDTAKLSKSSYDVPVVMGPNPNAEFESDEFGDDISLDEWQEMMEEAEEEEEEDEDEDYEDYIEKTDLAYEDEDGTTYLGMSMLPAVSATVKKTEKSSGIARLFKKSRSVETEAVVMAGTVRLGELVEGIAGATKKIGYLGGDNYRLHLDISGKGQALDIVLVIDSSGSMDERSGLLQPTKMENLKRILIGTWGQDGFVDQIFSKNPESRISVISYSDDAVVKSNWSSDKLTLEFTINTLEANGGTNYEDGLVAARDILKTKDPTHLPYVIFLSDGNPTFANKPVNEFGKGTVGGNGNSDNSYVDGEDKKVTVGQETLFAAEQFRKDPAVSGVTIYSVGIGKDYNEKYLNAIAGGDPSFVFPGDDLQETFKTILSSLKLENVKIEDTLTQYVELPGGSLDGAKVEVYKENNSTHEKTVLNENEYDLNYSDKKLTLDLSKAEPEGKLLEGYTYAIEFNVQVTQAAKDEFAKNGYPEDAEGNPILGGPDTGETSDGQAGFPSNAEAKVTWKNNSNGYTYPVPVVQIKEKPQVAYHKRAIQSDSDKEVYDLTLDVTGLPPAGGGTVTTVDPTDIVFVLDESASMRDQIAGPVWNPIRRQDVVNEAMKDILSDETGVFQYNKEKVNIRVKGYIFSGSKTQTKPGENSWYTSSKEAEKGLTIDAPWSAGTQPRSALDKAIKTLKTNSNAALKYVIYLTDGEPDEEDETVGGLDILKNADAPGIKFYPISINNNPDNNWDGQQKTYMEQVKDAAIEGGMACEKVYDGRTAEEIKAVFKEVTDSITNEIEESGSGMSNVVIEDELSEWAEFADSEITANDFTVVRSDGKPVNCTITPPSENNKNFKIQFNEPLENGVIYTVTVKIKPSQTAKDEYAKTGEYPNTSAPDTGTHSEEKGFFSNKNATLSFIYDGVNYTGDNAYEYPHPVIQVPETGSFTVQKIVEGKDSGDGQKFIINIDQMVNDGQVSFSSVALANGEVSAAVPVNGTQTFKISEAVPMEYSFNTIKVFDNNAEGGPKDVTNNKYQNEVLTVSSGDDLTVQVINSFGHKGYFHSKAQVTNYTTGDVNTPFAPLGRQAAETQPKAESAKKKVEIEEEEGETLV